MSPDNLVADVERPDALPEAPRRRQSIDSTMLIKAGSAVVAFIPFAALICVLVILFSEALPAIKYNGTQFITGTIWNAGGQYAAPVTTKGVYHLAGTSFGAKPLILGTLYSSIIAMIIAVPISIGAAVTVVHKLPPRLSRIAGLLLEMLAGIPSVIYGLWGVLTLGPFLARHFFPWLSRHFPTTGPLKFLGGDPGHGLGLLTTGIVLAIMIIPIVSSTTRDLLRQVPTLAEEGGAALGLTDREIISKISLRWVASGIVGAGVLGLARALGETMAVAMISGTILGADPTNIYSPFASIAGTIVTQLDGAFQDGTGFYLKTLAEVGLVLILITLIANLISRLLVARGARTSLPVGRGI